MYTPPLEMPPLLSGRFPPFGGGGGGSQSDGSPPWGGGPQKHATSQLRLYIKFFASMPLWVLCTVQNLGLWVT